MSPMQQAAAIWCEKLAETYVRVLVLMYDHLDGSYRFPLVKGQDDGKLLCCAYKHARMVVGTES
eukprot:scaffold290184_cov50-Prasinocladus_malaysianus.AAC.1